MPTYQYECASCGHEFEMLQTMNEHRLKKCPQCGQSKLNRLIGAGSGIIFKGTGFYETDYKRKSSPVPAKNSPASPAGKPEKAPAGAGSHGCSPSCGCAA